jgi:hypothetical protein
MIHSRLSVTATALFLLAALHSPVLADDVTTEARILRGQITKQVLSQPPLQLAWDSPDKTFWMVGENPEPRRDEVGQVTFANSVGTMGLRHRTFRHGGVSLTTTPIIRAEAVWEDADMGARDAVGAAVFEELAVALPAGLQFHAKGGIGDRTGVSVPNPRGAAMGFAVRGEAGVSGSLGALGHPGTRFDLLLVSTQAFVSEPGEEHPPSSCELKLELVRKDTAPLRIGGSCPGAMGEGRVTISIGGRF